MSQLRGRTGGEGLLSDVYTALRIVSSGPAWAPELDSEPTVHLARRTRLYGAAYERPRRIPSAKGKVLQVGGKLCGAGTGAPSLGWQPSHRDSPSRGCGGPAPPPRQLPGWGAGTDMRPRDVFPWA